MEEKVEKIVKEKDMYEEENWMMAIEKMGGE